MYDFTNKVAVITGGAQSMGLLTAQALIEKGAKVVIGDIQVQAGTEAIAKLNQGQLETVAIFHQCDVTKHSQLHNLLDLATQQFGHLDILINNAGVMDTPIDRDPQGNVAHRCIDINLGALVDATTYAVNHWNQQADRTGVVINLGSMAGFMALKDMPAYCASKAGVIMYTKALAHLGPKIRVNAVAPGWVNTKFIPNDEVYTRTTKAFGTLEPKDVVKHIVGLIEDEKMAGDVMIVKVGEEEKLCEVPKSTEVEATIMEVIEKTKVQKQ